MREDGIGKSKHRAGWIAVLGLVGLDYFSSLAYHPSIAYEAAGGLAPIATAVLAAITLFGVAPVYGYIAARSPNGQGAVFLLERLLHGWLGKFLILGLLGFSATDFVITRTVSAADAAEHILHNELGRNLADSVAEKIESVIGAKAGGGWTRWVPKWNRQIVVTLFVSILGSIFWVVFRKASTRRVLGLAVVVTSIYVALSALVVGAGLWHLLQHRELIDAWLAGVRSGEWFRGHRVRAVGDLTSIGLLCLVAFPQLVLGLSGFELSLVVMPLIKEGHGTKPGQPPRERIWRTWLMLVVAAVVMSVLLVGASLSTTILIPPEELTPTGEANHRALAYLAHGGAMRQGGDAVELCPWFGERFGTLYDLSSVLILGLAGASVMLGLRDQIPPALLRFGMEFQWAHNVDAIMHLFNLLNLVIAVAFVGSVSAQQGAYATAVLALISSSAVVAALDIAKHAQSRGRAIVGSTFFIVVATFFHLALGAMLVQKPDGLKIAASFVATTTVVSILSRFARSLELRFSGFRYKDAQSRFLWESLQALEFPVLVPHRPDGHSLLEKESRIRRLHRIPEEMPVVFVQTHLGDCSDFAQEPTIEVCEQQGRFVIDIHGCTSIPHTIAAVAIELSKVGRPPELHFGWSDDNPMVANLDFVLFGRGNVPWMVRALLKRAVHDPDRRPPIVMG